MGRNQPVIRIVGGDLVPFADGEARYYVLDVSSNVAKGDNIALGLDPGDGHRKVISTFSKAGEYKAQRENHPYGSACC
jgi:hypothetical protein